MTDIRNTANLDSHSPLWGLKRFEATYTTSLIFTPFDQILHRIVGHSFDFMGNIFC